MAESEGSDNDSSLDITVKTCTGKIIALQLEGSDTIFDVKTKIQRKVCIPVEEQAMLFDGMLLEEDIFTLANFGINSGSTLTLLRRSRGLVPIFVKFDNGYIQTLKVKLSDTINSVKTNINPTMKPSESVLIFNDTLLDDDSNTLCDFDIKKGSTLTFMYKRMALIKIFVKTLAGETKSLDVQPSDSIAKVKSRVHDPDGVLIFNETVLEDTSNVSDFDIKNGSTLTLLHKSPGRSMQIFVKTLAGETKSLTVEPSYTIVRVKSSVGDPDGVLIFNETVLKDSSNVSDFDINNGSILTLLPKSTGRMQIFVSLMFTGGKRIPLEVKHSDTMLYVKAKIYDIEGIPTSEQILMLDGCRLNDSWTLDDYSICKGGIIDLFMRM